jgi:vitamin B12 transporter
MALYRIDVDNLITYDRSVGQNFNVEEAKIQGAEFSGGYERNGWRASAALTYMDPEDQTNNKQLVRRTKQTARFDLDKTMSNVMFGGSIIAEGDRYNDAKNEELLAGFATLDLRVGWNFAPSWSTRLTVNNVLDKEYSTADGFYGKYISAGRTAMLSVRYDIQ